MRWVWIIALGVCVGERTLAQWETLKLSLVLRGSYTTTSKVFYNPDSPSPTLRAQHLPLEDIYGYGFELRIQRPEDSYFLAITVDFLSKSLNQDQFIALTNPPRFLPVMEGIRSIPVELSLRTYVPLGSENFHLFMGGGIGMYFAERVLRVVDADAKPQRSSVGYGIHVESGLEYQLHPAVRINLEMRFRDPEIRTVNRFDRETTVHEGSIVLLPKGDIATKVNLDGLNFGLGVILSIP
ncbi:MAG TPA: hypothetical protein VNN76_03370 [Bacteroidota bacterium]|nr:hypothetical protein [Bacteroidota bacterium]